MHHKKFEDMVGRLSGQSPPSCPGNLEANVLRRIRLDEDSRFRGVWSWLGELMPQTGFMASVLTIAVMISSMAAFLTTSAYAKKIEQQQLMSYAMDFNIIKDTHLVSLDRE